jgi:hypothetical protein
MWLWLMFDDLVVELTTRAAQSNGANVTLASGVVVRKMSDAAHAIYCRERLARRLATEIVP